MVKRLVVMMAIACSLIPVSGRSDEVHDAEAKSLYLEGKDAFEHRDYPRAYERFKRAFLLCQRPELLFNMASALQEQGRPGEAAESLKTYLRLSPSSPQRPDIERRIVALEEAQRLIDAENKRASAPAAVAASPSTAPPVAVHPAATSLSERPATVSRRRRLGLAIGLSLGAAAVITAVTVGLVLGLKSTPTPTPGSFPTVEATP